MLRDRYASQDLLALVPKLQLALDPELAPLDQLLDDEELFARVRADLARRRPHTTTRGRRGRVVVRNDRFSSRDAEKCAFRTAN